MLSYAFVAQLVGQVGLAQVLILLTKHMFDWKATTITMWLALDSGSKVVALFVVLPLIQRCVPRHWWLAHDLSLIKVVEDQYLSRFLWYMCYVFSLGSWPTS